ncbi:hypothetical protein PRZ48_006656 [Zasmidium cellare]|uniref:Uncharacterized protein n=1 Tax=Zasmidium cellare TaxID=395010 RepID=A0ABR0EQX8_ZASCE|nr:hypothetical protein PRZ48_006656 [Zasmidium cellare]
MLSNILLPLLLTLTTTCALPSQLTPRDDFRYSAVEYFSTPDCADRTGMGAKSYVPGGTNPGCFNLPPGSGPAGMKVTGWGCKTWWYSQPDCPDGQENLVTDSSCRDPAVGHVQVQSVVVSCA